MIALRTLLAALAAATLLPLSTGAAPPVLRAGYAESDITPALGGSMPGYFADRKSTGVLDPLKAKVVVLRQGATGTALVSLDLIGLGAPAVQRIREAVAARVTPRLQHIWVHATHSHTGAMVPRTGGFTSDAETIFPGFYPGVVDPAWVEALIERTADAVARADRALAEETAPSLHEGRADGIAFYRRFFMRDGTLRTNPGRNNPEVIRPAGEIDPRVHVVRLPASRTLITIFGVHPDCVGGTQYSADYPAHLTSGMKRRLGDGWNVLYLNACCGNINHVNVRDPNQLKGEQESRRIGEVLADSVQEALKTSLPFTATDLRGESVRVSSRLRKPADADFREAELRLRENRNTMEFNGLFAPAALILGRTRDRVHQAEVSALKLGSLGLAALPGEIFVELGREVEWSSPLRPTRTIGLTNGSMGYIPHRLGYAEGGYEAGYRSARYEPGTGHAWARAAAGLLQRLATR